MSLLLVDDSCVPDLRNLSVSAAHDPDHGDINLISKAYADLLQLAFSNRPFEYIRVSLDNYLQIEHSGMDSSQAGSL